MTQFIKVGTSLINIEAIARIEDLSSPGGMAEVNVHLSNGEYIVVRDRDALSLLDFFFHRTTGGSRDSFTSCPPIKAPDVPACSRN